MNPASATWDALGSSAVVVVDDDAALADVRRAVEGELVAIDRACSRFRADSELSRLHEAERPPDARRAAAHARPSPSRWSAARQTDGLVDPTIGAAVIAAGYDRDFADLSADVTAHPRAATPGWRSVRLDRERMLVQLAPGARLDLGATAKAWAADRAAAAAVAAAGPTACSSASAATSPSPARACRAAGRSRSPTAIATLPTRPSRSAAGGLATSSTDAYADGAAAARSCTTSSTRAPVVRHGRLADGQRRGADLRPGEHGEHGRDRPRRRGAGVAGGARAFPPASSHATARVVAAAAGRSTARRPDGPLVPHRAPPAPPPLVLLTLTLVLGVVDVERLAVARASRAS